MNNKQALSLTDEYLHLLSPQDYFAIADRAHNLLIMRPIMNKDAVTEVWVEAVVQIFLQKGLLRPINLIKLELAK